MTLDEYLASMDDRVEEIRSVADDPERAHALQNKLFSDALAQVAGCTDVVIARLIAAVALQVTGIEFPRWCA